MNQSQMLSVIGVRYNRVPPRPTASGTRLYYRVPASIGRGRGTYTVDVANSGDAGRSEDQQEQETNNMDIIITAAYPLAALALTLAHWLLRRQR